jgi:hypothetical protein
MNIKFTIPARRLTPIYQPTSGGYCAFAVLGMVSGKTLDEVVSISGLGDSGDGLEQREMSRILDRLKIRHGKWRPAVRKTYRRLNGRAFRMSDEKIRTIPDFCIALVSRGVEWSHGVAILDGWVYDPNPGCPVPIRMYEQYVWNKYTSGGARARWNSFLPILQSPPERDNSLNLTW